MSGLFPGSGGKTDDNRLSGGKFAGMQFKNIQDPNEKQNVVKVAIEVPNKMQHLYMIDQDKDLQFNINDFCARVQIQDTGTYALKNYDTNQYITEHNRTELKHGDVLRLVQSPNKVVDEILSSLRIDPNSPNPEHMAKRNKALALLLKESSDVTFAKNIISCEGLEYLIKEVESERLPKKDLGFVLTSILELVDHGIVDIDKALTPSFVKYISSIVMGKVYASEPLVLQRSMGILELAVIQSNLLYPVVVDEVKVPGLTNHLQNANMDVMQSTIALMNSMFMKGSFGKKGGGRRHINDTISQKQIRKMIQNNVIRASGSINNEMAHQLYVLQVLTLNVAEERMNTKLSPSNQNDNRQLHELYLMACEAIDHHPPNTFLPNKKQPVMTYDTTNLRKFGFVDLQNPALDFQDTPPGLLSLDLMVYFAKRQPDNFTRLILENNSRGAKQNCPFVKASIALAKFLCEVMRIGTQPTVTGQYRTLFFTCENPMEDFFCACVVLFNKTWKDMAAITEDFDKVMSVVVEQITTSLDTNPTMLENFKQKLPSYSAILKRREQQLIHMDDLYSKAAPVLELRRRLLPDMRALVKENRLTRMKQGARFHKLTKKHNKTLWQCRLANNEKYLQYGDSSTMPDTIDLANVKDLVTGKHNPHLKNVKQGSHRVAVDQIFTLVYDHDQVMHFVAHDYTQLATWVDGLSALLGREMPSQKARDDIEYLMRYEVKLKLLELENVTIPEKQPQIPDAPPADYCFALADF